MAHGSWHMAKRGRPGPDSSSPISFASTGHQWHWSVGHQPALGSNYTFKNPPNATTKSTLSVLVSGKRKMQTTQAENANHLIRNTYNIWSNASLLHRFWMVNGSLLMAQVSWPCLKAHGSWPIRNLARGPPSPRLSRQILYWSWALKHEPWSVSHEPLTIDYRWVNELFDYILWALFCFKKHCMFSGRYWSHIQDFQDFIKGNFGIFRNTFSNNFENMTSNIVRVIGI